MECPHLDTGCVKSGRTARAFIQKSTVNRPGANAVAVPAFAVPSIPSKLNARSTMPGAKSAPPCKVPWLPSTRSCAFPSPVHQLTRPEGGGSGPQLVMTVKPTMCWRARIASNTLICPSRTTSPKINCADDGCTSPTIICRSRIASNTLTEASPFMSPQTRSCTVTDAGMVLVTRVSAAKAWSHG